VRLALQGEWAARTLLEAQSGKARLLARQEIGAPAAAMRYYRTHLSSYRSPERRSFDIIERIGSAAAARSLARSLGSGPRFAARAFHETFTRPVRFDQPSGKGKFLKAVFVAHVGAVSEPLPIAGHFGMFVLRAVTKPRLRSFGAVRQEIEGMLITRRERMILSSLRADYERSWRARTFCAKDVRSALCPRPEPAS
jgi:hypothetical protein